MHDALLAQLDELFLQAADPFASPAPIDFNLFFPHAAGKNGAMLPLKMGPRPGKARQHVLQLGNFHLHLGLRRFGMFSEDLEDDPGTVTHIATRHLLEVAHLGRCQRIVKNHKTGAAFAHHLADLLGLADTQQTSGVEAVAPLHYPSDTTHPQGIQQQLKLVQVVLQSIRSPLIQGDADNDGFFAL